MSRQPNTLKTKRSNVPRRRLRQKGYRSLRLEKRIKSDQPKLPSVARLIKQSFGQVWRNWKPFLFASIVYGLLMLVFVRGFAGVGHVINVNNVTTSTTVQTNISPSSLSLFGALVGGSGVSKSDISNLYQTAIIIICSLAFIWLLRQTHDEAPKAVRSRDAFYKGMYPLVPFIIVLVVVTLELIPAALANGVYISIIAGNVALNGAEQALWYIVMFLLVILSLYLISSSLIALYVSTLPNMTPMKALRSAHGLVQYRRWTVMRKIISFPLIVIVLSAIVIVPLIAVAPIFAQWIFFLGMIAFLPLLHSYMYSLYRVML